MKRLKMGLVGCGWVSDWHARDGLCLLPELFELTACCDTDPKRTAEFAARYGIARQCARYEELLAMPDLDAVVICTPPALHHPMVMAALAAGKHVVCEKPFVRSLAEVDAIRAAEAKSAGRVMPIFQYRFGDGIARVRAVIQAGLAGKHYLSTAETAKRRGPDYYAVPWRGKFATELGGVLLTQAIHIHDLLLWLVGPVEELACFKTTRVNPIEVEDCAVASLKLADGSLATLSATLGSARQVTRLRLCYEHVTFEKTCYDEDSAHPGEEPWLMIPKTPEAGREIERVIAGIPPARAWFARQYELFHEALQTGGPFPVTLDDARTSLELITALFDANERRAVVRLPLGPDHRLYGGWVPAA